MQGIDFENEEFSVSEAVCLSLHGFDFVVGCLQWSGGDGVEVPCEESVFVESQGLGKVLEHSDSRCLGPSNPVFQKDLSGPFVGLFPEESEIVLHVIRRGQRFIQCERLCKPLSLVPTIIEVFRVFQKEPSSPFQDLFLEQVGGFPIQISPENGEFLVVEFDDMEVVKDDYGLGQVFCDSLDVGVGHIDGHGFDLCCGLFQSFEEWVESLGVFAFSDEDYRSALQIKHYGHEPVSLADSDLINCNAAQMADFGPGEFPTKVTLLDILDHVPTHAQMMGHVLNRHMLGKLQDIPFKLPDEAPVVIGKADFDLPDHAAGAALHALDSQFYDNLLEGKARRPEPPVHGPSPDNTSGATTRTSQALRVLLYGEPDLPTHVLRLPMMVAHDVQGMIQKADGHALPSFQDFFKPRKDQACPLLFFNYTYAITG